MILTKFLKKVAATAMLLACSFVPSHAITVEMTYSDSGQWTFNQDTAVSGNYVATAVAYGVQIWDLTDPESPAMKDDYYLSGKNAWAIDWVGDTIYATTVDGYLYIFDVSDVTNITLLSSGSGYGANPDLVVYDNNGTRWMYLAGNSSTDFRIRNVTNPLSITGTGNVALGGSTKYLDIDTAGSVAYVVTSGLVYSINISNPATPAILDTETLTGTHIGVDYSSNKLAVASGNVGFVLYDASNPSSLAIQSTTIPSAGLWPDGNDAIPNVRDISIVGTNLYAICNNVGPICYDITDLTLPVLSDYDPVLDQVDPIPAYYVFQEGIVVGDNYYSSHWGHYKAGVDLFDLSSDGLPFIGRTESYDYVRDVEADGGYVYGCTGGSGVVCYKQESDGSLTLQSTFYVEEVWGADAVGSLLFVASTLEGLVILNYSNPLAPFYVGSVNVGQARSVIVDRGIAYVAAFSQGLVTVDVSTPSAPVVLDTYDTFSGEGPVNLSKVGNFIICAERGYGMNTYNVSNPSDIVRFGSYDPAGSVADVAVTSGLVAYAVVGTEVQRINLYNPSSPAYVCSFSSSATGVYGERSSVTGTSTLIYVTRGNSGVSVYKDVATPTAPVEADAFDTAKTAYNLFNRLVGNKYYTYVADYAGMVALLNTIGGTKPGDPGYDMEQ